MPFRACDLCTRFYCDSDSALHVISVQSLNIAQWQHFPGSGQPLVVRPCFFGGKSGLAKNADEQHKTMPWPFLGIIAAQFVKLIAMTRMQLSRQIHRKLIIIISRPDAACPVQQHDNNAISSLNHAHSMPNYQAHKKRQTKQSKNKPQLTVIKITLLSQQTIPCDARGCAPGYDLARLPANSARLGLIEPSSARISTAKCKRG